MPKDTEQAKKLSGNNMSNEFIAPEHGQFQARERCKTLWLCGCLKNKVPAPTRKSIRSAAGFE